MVTSALALEVRTQARRRDPDGAARWEGTDTAIVVVLAGLAAVSAVVLVLRSFTPPEQSAAASFAALYALLAVLSAANRWATAKRALSVCAAGISTEMIAVAQAARPVLNASRRRAFG